MKRLRFNLTNNSSNKILKGDQLILETKDATTGKIREFIVEVTKIVSDIPRCQGCNIRLDNKQSYKYKTGFFCWDCYERRRIKQKKTSF
jgi:hypothetical protein